MNELRQGAHPEDDICLRQMEKDAIREADGEDECVTDLSDIAKVARTVNMDPDRFNCILGGASLKSKPAPREYLDGLPYYIQERSRK